MINSSKISIHRFIATTLFCVVQEWPHSSGNIHDLYRGYYMVARRYEFYFRVAKQYFTNERSE